MNYTRAELKEQARQQMSGKFGMLFLCFLVVWGIGFICTRGFSLILMPNLFSTYRGMFDAITSTSPDVIEDIVENEAIRLSAYSNLANVLSLAYRILIYPMISVGLTQVLLNLTYGDVPQVGTVFEPYKTWFGKSIGTVWLKRIFEILWMIPFYFVWLLCAGIVIAVFVSDDRRMKSLMDRFSSAYGLGDNLGDAILAVLGMIISLILITLIVGLILMIPYYIIISKYAMTLYIMNENPTLSSTRCVDESKAIMQGHRWEYVLLKLSFLPWFLLCFIPIVGWLSLIYTIPYMQVTITDYYHNIKQSAYQYAESGDITEIVEEASDRIMGEGFEQ